MASNGKGVDLESQVPPDASKYQTITMASNAKTVDMTGQVSPTPSVESKEEDAVADQGARTEQQERLARRSAEEYEAKKTAASGRSSGTASNSANSPPSVADAVANRPARPSDSKSKPAVAAVTPGAVPVTSPSPGPSEVKSARREEARQATSSDMPPDAESRPYSDSNPRPSSGKSKPAVAAVKPGVVSVDSPPSPTTARSSGKSRRTPSSTPTGVESMNSSSFDSAALREEGKAARHSGGPSDAVARVGAVESMDSSHMDEKLSSYLGINDNPAPAPDIEEPQDKAKDEPQVVARMVTDEPEEPDIVAVAQTDTVFSIFKRYKRRIAVILVLIIIGSILAVTLLGEGTVESFPTPSPTVSMAPTNSRQYDIDDALQKYGPSFDNDAAYEWLMYEDTWRPFNVSEGVEESTLWLERYAMAAFYFATGGATWYANVGWLNTTTSVCYWYGAICEDDERVTELGFAHVNNLIGTLPDEIGELQKLKLLNFWMHPGLTGSLPETMGALTDLQILHIWANNLEGPLPSGIGNWTNLEQLWLWDQHLEGTIPTEIGHLSNMEQWFVWNNNFEGTIPTEIAGMSKALIFNADNQLTGSIPTEIGAMTECYWFDFDNNKLTGTIPTEAGLLGYGYIVYFGVGLNNLNGTIPTEIGSLFGLSIGLNLGGNQLTGSIPSELASLVQLPELDLSGNSLTGGIPSYIETFSGLNLLHLAKNPLGGSIPPGIFDLPMLTDLRIYENDLTGSLPSLSNLKGLTSFFVSNNFLTGTVPELPTTFLEYQCLVGGNNFSDTQNALDAGCIDIDPKEVNMG